MPTAFYQADGDRLLATALTRGPWHRDLQHGGPPAALLARAIEAAPSDVPRSLARVTVELMRPIPIGPVTVEVEPPVGGRQVDRVEARLRVGDAVVAKATGLRIRAATVVMPARAPDVAALAPGPEGVAPFVFPFFAEPIGYQAAVELRLVRGTWGDGPVAAWIRPTVPLVEGEPTSPACAVMIVADAANGIRPVLPIDRYTFVNADLTVALARQPVGPWIGLDVDATAGDAGAGLVRAAIHDQRGLCGQAAQALVVAAR
ncbi:MAG: thioesterase family protein [Kofleriaceae bacterium]